MATSESTATLLSAAREASADLWNATTLLAVLAKAVDDLDGTDTEAVNHAMRLLRMTAEKVSAAQDRLVASI